MIGRFIRYGTGAAAVGLLTCLTLFAAPAESAAQGMANESLAAVSVNGASVDLYPNRAHAGATLTVSGGAKTYTLVFSAGEHPAIERFDAEGELLPDGFYTWELELTPDARTRRELMRAASQNDGKAPEAWLPQTGSFAIRGGAFASPDAVEPGAAKKLARNSTMSAADSTFALRSSRSAEDEDGSSLTEGEALARSKQEQFEASVAAVQSGPVGADSDAATLAAGPSLDAALVPGSASTSGFSRSTIPTRTVEPGGKNGRPEVKQDRKSERR